MRIGPGEKIHEDMITASDSINTKFRKLLRILPSDERLRARYDLPEFLMSVPTNYLQLGKQY